MYLGILLSVYLAWRLRRISSAARARLLSITGSAMFLSEIWKQWYLTSHLYGYYNVWYFPFQLCSLPMYLCPLYVFLSEKARERVDCFLMTFSLMGGLAVFLAPTGMWYPRMSLTIHSFLWHYLLIFTGFLTGFCRTGKGAAFPRFRQSLPIFAVSLCLAMLLNAGLWPLGEISMFYLSPFEASTQPVIHEIALRYGILTGNISYLAAMLAGAGIFYRLWRRFFLLRSHS